MTDLTKMPPTFVRCRTFGHAWDDVDPTDAEQDDFDLLWSGNDYDLLVTACPRCSMRRLDVVGEYGALRSRRYQYPEGYLMAKGDTRPKRAEFRVQLLANRLAAMKAKRGKK
jgi:hypothetical protein